MAILEAEPGILGKYMEGNKEGEASGQIISSEEFPIGWHKKILMALIFNWLIADCYRNHRTNLDQSFFIG